MLATLDEAAPLGKPRPFHILMAEVLAFLASEAIKPFMHIWLDLSSGAARGLEPHLDIVGEWRIVFLRGCLLA
jgi:hypothetical protein